MPSHVRLRSVDLSQKLHKIYFIPLAILEILDFQESCTIWSVKGSLGDKSTPRIFQHMEFGIWYKYHNNSAFRLLSWKSIEKVFWQKYQTFYFPYFAHFWIFFKSLSSYYKLSNTLYFAFASKFLTFIRIWKVFPLTVGW